MRHSTKWKRRLGRIYGPVRRLRNASQQCGLVLTYHSVGPTALGLPLQHFREQLAWLKENTAVVSIDALLSADWPESPSGVTCAITFDDGYASVFRHAFPVLRELQLPATVYVVCAAIDDRNARSSSDFQGLYPDEEMLTWPQIQEMQREGISFGSHLVHHFNLTALPKAEADEELRISKQTIEQQTQRECSSFCFPWGKYDDRAVAAVREAGYRNAVIAIQGRLHRGEPMDLFRTPRADVRREYQLSDFVALVRGDLDYLAYWQRLRRYWTR